MDTISQDTKPNYLPILGLIIGLVGLVFAAFALVKVTSTNRALGEKIDAVSGRLDNIESTANSAEQLAQGAKNSVTSLQSQTQDGFNQIGGALTSIQDSIKKLQEVAKGPPPRPAKAPKGTPSAEGSAPGTISADGTYTIKSGDSLAKIARANGISLADLTAANPGVNPKRLKVGQKINLPAKQQ
jgi:LysM repeat protein